MRMPPTSNVVIVTLISCSSVVAREPAPATAVTADKPGERSARVVFEQAEELRKSGENIVDVVLLYDLACTLGEERACLEVGAACRAVSAIRDVPAIATKLTDARCEQVTKGSCTRGDQEACAAVAVAEMMRKEDALEREQRLAAAKARADQRGPAHIVIDTETGWRAGARLEVRIDGARVERARAVKGGSATIEVRDGKAVDTRIASVEPGVEYTLRGNPCAMWTLQATKDPYTAADRPLREGSTSIAVDASALPARFFPVTVQLGSSDTDVQELVVPRLLRPDDVVESAMCVGAGTRVRAVGSASRQPLIDAVLIAHPGAPSTLRIEGPGLFRFGVDP